MRWEQLFEREMLVVSGKGGTGKSTVAAAMALAAAGTGRSVLLAEVEGRGELATTLGVPQPGYEERPLGPNLWGLSITPHEAAVEYMRMYFGLDRISRAVLRAGVVDQLVGFVPGFRDLLISGKLYEIESVRATNPRDAGRPLYDLVVVDAPPTGQIAGFLASASAFAEMIRVGRMKRQAVGIDRLLRERAGVVLVSLPDEMSVAETVETLPALERAGGSLSAIVANRIHESILPPGAAAPFAALDGSGLAALAEGAGVSLGEERAADALADAREFEARVREERRFVRSLGAAGPVLTLPDVRSGSEATPGAVAAALAEVMGSPVRIPVPTARVGSARGRAPARTRERRPDAPLEELLEGARIVIVCGSGGVGKTTVSAALAVRLADGSKDTALLTVDPARRLATALRLPMRAGERTHVPLGRGRNLDAMQLDTQRTFDELIERYAGSPDRRDRILANRFYRRIADTLVGTHEYMAMEKLYELATEESHDAIVVDTPPTRSALSFLDAPTRLTDFLGGRLLRWLLWPGARAGRLTLGMARIGATAFAKTAGRLVGAESLADVADFLGAFEGMYGGFRERASRVLELLEGEDCAFVVVTSPTEASLEEAGYFTSRLAESGMRAAAVVVNRWHGDRLPLPAGARAAADRLRRGGPADRAAAAVLLHRLEAEPGERSEAQAVARFAGRNGGVPVVRVPELAGDVHDVAGLRRVGRHLFPADRPAVDRDRDQAERVRPRPAGASGGRTAGAGA